MKLRLKKFFSKKTMDYVKLFVALVILFIAFKFWQGYDLITIPIKNYQMEPNFMPTEFYLGKRFVENKKLHYGDVVYYEFPHPFLKSEIEGVFLARVIGLPGDTISIRDGIVMRNKEKLSEEYLNANNILKESQPEIIVPRGKVYLLVDNRKSYRTSIYCKDSRFWGPIFIETLSGKISK